MGAVMKVVQQRILADGLRADGKLVSEIVNQGGRVYAVEPRHETLEDRFLQLLKEQDG